MPVPFLALNTLDGTTPQLRRYVGATSSNVGVPFGTLDTASIATDHSCPRYRAIQFGGHQTFYAATGNQIYRTTDAGASWASVHTLVSPIATDTFLKSGLYIIPINGVPTLCITYLSSASTIRAAKSSDGTSWTTEGPFTIPGTSANTQLTDEIVFRNSIWLHLTSFSGGTTTVAFYSPGSSSGAGFTKGAVVANCPDSFVIWNDSLYMIRQVSGDRYITDISAGVLSNIVTISTTSIGSAASGQKYAAFVDGANLITFHYSNLANGWLAYRTLPNLTTTLLGTVSGGVVPFNMTGTTGGGNAPSSSRCVAFVDTEAMPGTTPVKYLLYAVSGASGQQWSLFRWNGDSVPMTLEDGGGNTKHALSCGTRAGGSYFWTPGDRHIEIVTRTAIMGGLRYSFKLYSPNPSVDAVTVRAWFGTGDDEYPLTAATLINPSVGSISSNTIIGLDAADNGATTFQVTWAAGTDGFPNGTRGKFLFEVF